MDALAATHALVRLVLGGSTCGSIACPAVVAGTLEVSLQFSHVFNCLTTWICKFTAKFIAEQTLEVYELVAFGQRAFVQQILASKVGLLFLHSFPFLFRLGFNCTINTFFEANATFKPIRVICTMSALFTLYQILPPFLQSQPLLPELQGIHRALPLTLLIIKALLMICPTTHSLTKDKALRPLTHCA